MLIELIKLMFVNRNVVSPLYSTSVFFIISFSPQLQENKGMYRLHKYRGLTKLGILFDYSRYALQTVLYDHKFDGPDMVSFPTSCILISNSELWGCDSECCALNHCKSRRGTGLLPLLLDRLVLKPLYHFAWLFACDSAPTPLIRPPSGVKALVTVYYWALERSCGDMLQMIAHLWQHNMSVMYENVMPGPSYS